MNRDQVKGRIDRATGKVKEEAGDAMDDKRMENEGRAQKHTGHVQSKVGDAAEKVRDKLDRKI